MLSVAGRQRHPRRTCPQPCAGRYDMYGKLNVLFMGAQRKSSAPFPLINVRLPRINCAAVIGLPFCSAPDGRRQAIPSRTHTHTHTHTSSFNACTENQMALVMRAVQQCWHWRLHQRLRPSHAPL